MLSLLAILVISNSSNRGGWADSESFRRGCSDGFKTTVNRDAAASLPILILPSITRRFLKGECTEASAMGIRGKLR